MTVKDALNRGANFFTITSLAILSTSIVHGLQVASDLPDKADELVLGVLALSGIAWYNIGRHRFVRSLVPFGLLAAGFVVKAAGMAFSEEGIATGSLDFAVTVFLLLAALIALWQYISLRNRDRRWVRRRHGYRI